MTHVFLSLAFIAWIGSMLRYAIRDLDVEGARRTIGLLVLHVLLPALVFRVVVQVESGAELVRIPLVMLLGTLTCLAVSMAIFSRIPLDPREKGALVLAGSFGNVTYVGLPVLQGMFPALGLQAAKVAVLCEVATTPLNLSLGVSAGTHYVAPGGRLSIGRAAVTSIGLQLVHKMLGMPALWAVLAALLWKASGAAVPLFLMQACTLLGNTVSGLMMLTLGMGLRYRAITRPMPLIVAVLIKLLISPALVLAFATLMKLAPPYREAVVMEGAMPSQLLTFVIADRIGLDVERLALCILLSTACSFVTLPLIRMLLPGG